MLSRRTCAFVALAGVVALGVLWRHSAQETAPSPPLADRHDGRGGNLTARNHGAPPVVPDVSPQQTGKTLISGGVSHRHRPKHRNKMALTRLP